MQGVKLPPKQHPKISPQHLEKVLTERKKIITLILEQATFIEIWGKTKKPCSCCNASNTEGGEFECTIYQENGNKYPYISLCSDCIAKYK